MRIELLFAVLAFGVNAPAQHMAHYASVGSAPLVDVRGTIQSVQIARGAGMPYLVVEDGRKTLRVYLGSMRYLIEQNFQPKTGQAVAVRAYRVNEDLLAATVSIQGQKTLRLRDEAGMPLWRGGWRGGGGSVRAEDAEKKQP